LPFRPMHNRVVKRPSTATLRLWKSLSVGSAPLDSLGFFRAAYVALSVPHPQGRWLTDVRLVV